DVTSVGVGDHLAGVACEAQILADQVVQAELLGAGHLDDAVDRICDRDAGDAAGGIVAHSGGALGMPKGLQGEPATSTRGLAGRIYREKGVQTKMYAPQAWRPTSGRDHCSITG